MNNGYGDITRIQADVNLFVRCIQCKLYKLNNLLKKWYLSQHVSLWKSLTGCEIYILRKPEKMVKCLDRHSAKRIIRPTFFLGQIYHFFTVLTGWSSTAFYCLNIVFSNRLTS